MCITHHISGIGMDKKLVGIGALLIVLGLLIMLAGPTSLASFNETSGNFTVSPHSANYIEIPASGQQSVALFSFRSENSLDAYIVSGASVGRISGGGPLYVYENTITVPGISEELINSTEGSFPRSVSNFSTGGEYYANLSENTSSGIISSTHYAVMENIHPYTVNGTYSLIVSGIGTNIGSLFATGMLMLLLFAGGVIAIAAGLLKFQNAESSASRESIARMYDKIERSSRTQARRRKNARLRK